jgi:hypothetical protein
MAIDLFADTGKQESELHPQFKSLRDLTGYAPARGLIRELQEHFVDPDGNFVEQFQTFGFDSRTFEFFLSAMLLASGHELDRSADRPDFLIVKEGVAAAIEAVTANPPSQKYIQPYTIFSEPKGLEEARQDFEHTLPIRLGSPLYTKLQKKYWELPHVKDRPLVLAIQDFHIGGALASSNTPLMRYLYGIGQRWWHDPEGNLKIENHELATHKVGDKEIPSGFFKLEGAENISAVLFCNTGTTPKFNRMGHQDKYKTKGVRMLRWGTCYDHTPNASLPRPFVYEVGGPAFAQETWGEGTVLMHNPYALKPLPDRWMGASLEQRLTNDQVVSLALEEFLPFGSLTKIFVNATRGDLRRETDNLMQMFFGLWGEAKANQL